jgi:hypothetical protein
VLVNTTGTRVNLSQDATKFSSIWNLTIGAGAGGWWETGPTPDDALVPTHKHLGYLCDNTIMSSWGYFRCGNAGEFSEAQGDIPHDIPFIQYDLNGLKHIDIIHVGQAYTFNSKLDAGDQPYPYDNNTNKGALNGIYKCFQLMRFTVEYTQEAVPGADDWYPIHPDLFQVSVGDPFGSSQSDTHIIVEGLDTWAKHVRVICNEPMLAKISNSDKSFRMLMAWLSEFQIFGQGYVFDPDTQELPEVKFTDDPDDEFRCMCDLEGNLIDLYRPTLLTLTKGMGLKYRTLVVENDDLWEFDHKTGATCADVSIGYKYLVTLLNSNSKENEWQVSIDYRPDVRIGTTIMCSALNPSKSFLVLGNVVNDVSGKITQSVVLSDYETPVTGEDPDEGDDCPS